MIGGNVTAVLRKTVPTGRNRLGEVIHTDVTTNTLYGYLDMVSGESNRAFKAKLEESTHVFLCDYVAIPRDTHNRYMVINNHRYDVLYIDNPMELCEHLEVYLKYVG